MQGWDLARLHEGLQTFQHSDLKQPSPITSYQKPLSQHQLVAQKVPHNSDQALDDWNSYPMQDVVYNTPYSYNSWNEAQYQTSLQIEPRKEVEGTNTFELDISTLKNEIQCPPQSTHKQRCSIHGTLDSQEYQPPGQGFDLRQDTMPNMSQSQEVQG